MSHQEANTFATHSQHIRNSTCQSRYTMSLVMSRTVGACAHARTCKPKIAGPAHRHTSRSHLLQVYADTRVFPYNRVHPHFLRAALSLSRSLSLLSLLSFSLSLAPMLALSACTHTHTHTHTHKHTHTHTHTQTASSSLKLMYIPRSFSTSAGSGFTCASCGSGGDSESREMKYSISTLLGFRVPGSRFRHTLLKPQHITIPCQRVPERRVSTSMCAKLPHVRPRTIARCLHARSSAQRGGRRTRRRRPDAVLDVRVFREVGTDAIEPAAVSPVERRDGIKRRRHGVLQVSGSGLV